MHTTTERPASATRHGPDRTASEIQHRKGVRLLVLSVPFAAAMFALWWLVATTNREGHHDAQLLPIFTLFFLVPAAYHLLRARYLRSKGR